MEVNELNSQLASLMNFGRTNVAAPATGEGFAQLLNRPAADDVQSQTPVKDNGRKDTKDVRPNDDRGDKAPRPEKRPVTDDKANAPVKSKENKRTDNKANASASDKNAVSNDNKSVADKSASTEISKVPVEESASSAVEQVEVPVENVEATAPAEAVVADGEAGAEVETSKKLEISLVVPLDALALMGTINVFNPQTGEMTQTTGAELAAQLAGNDAVQVLQYTPEGGESTFEIAPVANQTQAALEAANGGKFDISAFQPVDAEELVKIDLSAVSAQVGKSASAKSAGATSIVDDMLDTQIEEQASKLGEVIGEDKKVKVNVSAQREEIARSSAKDLLVEAKIVDDAVSASSKPADVSAKINVEATKQPISSMAANGNNAPGLNAAPLYNAAAPISAPVTESGTAPNVAASVEVSSANLTNVTAAGGEFVKAAKADTTAENNQTSFRDTYKGMSREVVEQVKVNITKSAVKGVDKIDISLKPEELGRIEVKMQIKDGKLQAHIISSRPDTMEALQKEMQTLEKAFNDAGFQTDEGSLSFSFREDSHANQNQERDNGLRNFIGDIFEKEASNDLLSGEAFQNQSWDGKSGLNIRV